MSQIPEPMVSQNVRQFAIKASIIFMLIVIAVGYIIQDIESVATAIKNSVPKEKNKILLLSFVQNPAALYRVAEIDEREGNLEYAIIDIELAIGLLEMHGATQQAIEKYTKKLQLLNSKKQVK